MTADSVVIIGGGQSGLAGAFAAREAGLRPVLLEAGDRTVGSWPEYYDSLTLFSPARYSGFPGAPFPGDPDHYPTRDEVVTYLEKLALGIDAEIHTNTRATASRASSRGFVVRTDTGESSSAAASSAPADRSPTRTSRHPRRVHRTTPSRRELPEPQPYAGHRVVVVGAGNSAIQIAHELAEVAT